MTREGQKWISLSPGIFSWLPSTPEDDGKSPSSSHLFHSGSAAIMHLEPERSGFKYQLQQLPAPPY